MPPHKIIAIVWLWLVPTGSTIIGVEDFDLDGKPEALLAIGSAEAGLLDVETGAMRWKWTAPTGAFLGSYKIWRHNGSVRLICFPQNSLRGVCLDLTSRETKPN